MLLKGVLQSIFPLCFFCICIYHAFLFHLLIYLDLMPFSKYKQMVMHDELNSYCGDGVKMDGILRFKGALRFEGYFKGEIQTSDTLIVGPSGKINAKVQAGSLFNMGEITGDVKSSAKISLLGGSRLMGNIDTPALISEEGALFRGGCTMPEKLQENFVEERESKIKKNLNATLQNFFIAAGQEKKEESGTQFLGVAFAGRRKITVAAVAVGVALMAAAIIMVLKHQDTMGTGVVARYIYERFAQDDPEKLLMLANTYFDEKRWGRAAATYERVKEISAATPQISRRLGEALENGGDLVSAAEHYEEYLKDNPKDNEIVDKLVKHYKDGSGKEKRIAFYEFLIDKRPDIEHAPKTLFALYKENRQFDKSLELYKRKLVSSPRTIENLLTIGRLQKTLGNIPDALKSFAEARDMNRSEKDAFYELGLLYHKTGLEDKALEAFTIYARQAADSPEALNNYGFSSLAQGKTDKAMEYFNAVLEREPQNLRAFLGLAITYSRLGDAEKAEAHCKKILAIDPDYAPGLNRLAWLYAQQKRNLDEARKYSLASMQYNENLPDYIDTLSEIYFQQREYDKALGLMEKAIVMRPANPYFRSQLEKFRAALNQAGQKN